MKNIFRHGLFLLIIIFTVSLSTSCSAINYRNTGSKSDNKGNENVKITKQIKIMLPGDEPEDENAVVNEINSIAGKELNACINVKFILWEDYMAKIYMMAASAEKFDMFLCFSGELPKMIANNQIKPINELLDAYGSDLKRVIPKDEFDVLTIDGKLYGIPSVYPRTEIAAHVIRKDLRINYGLPEIDDITTFENYLDTVKKKEGIIPYATDLGRIGGGLSRAFIDDHINWYWGDDISSYVMVDWGNKPYRVENNFTSPLTLKCLQWNRKAYKNGWFPKDILTMQNSKNLFVTGKAAVIPADLYNLQELCSKLKINVPNAQVELITFQKEKTHVKMGQSNNFACISSTSENPEAAVKFLNWVRRDQDNYDLFMYGIKGKDYTLAGDKVQRLPAAVNPENWRYSPNPWLSRDFTYERVLADDPKEYIDALKYWSNLKYVVCPMGGFTINNAGFQSEQAQISTLVLEQWLPIYVGLKDKDEDYTNFLSNLDKAGFKKVISDIQRQLDEYMKARNQ